MRLQAINEDANCDGIKLLQVAVYVGLRQRWHKCRFPIQIIYGRAVAPPKRTKLPAPCAHCR